MAHRKLASFQRHVLLVRQALTRYLASGYVQIFADLPGHRPPRSVYFSGFVPSRPDLTCRDAQNRLVLVEAETCDTAHLEETEQQWRLFRAYADACRGEFHLVVPSECEVAVRERLAEIGLQVDRLLVFPVVEA